jgi:hypothetical protein
MASNNGYYWSRVGALHAPDGAHIWTGSVVARSDNSGMQQVWNTDDINNVLYYMRTFTDDGTGQGRTFSDWRSWATPSGLIELPDLGPTIDELLAEMADDIDNAAQALLFYEQTGEPVPGVSGVPAEIPVGSVWVDTDDNRHTYSWDGDSWVSIESTLFADIEAELALQQAAIEAAATAASDAMDFAEQLTMVYRQNSAPTNPDSNGRALVADDVWFDSDDANAMYTWTGSAWVLLGIATEDYVDNSTEPIFDSIGFLNKTYRQTSAPTNPDVDGRALVAQDTWFDSDANNMMYRWNGSAWVLALVGLGSPYLETDPTPNSGIKLLGNNLIAYGGGVATVTIDGDDGILFTTGGVITGGTIDGAVVTGGTIQSEATAARGIKMNSTALVAYNSSGVAQVTITAATGAITLAGAMTGGGTITGPIFQTSASANTGIKISSAGMFGYDGSTAKFSLNNSTGILTLAGGVLTAGTIDGAVVTGGTLQTEATAARGIKFNSSGMTVYDGSGGSVMTIVASTGAVTINGALAAISLTGVTVTGGILQTTATASRGIKITSTGLIAYDNSGVTMATLDATTGVLTVAGGVLTGGSLTGAIVTGGTVQTEATASAGIKMNSAGFVAYDAAGGPTVTIDAATGEAIFKGAITSGSTIDGAALTIGPNIRLNSAEGLYVVQPGGGRIQFPADGTDAIVQANIIAKSLTVQEGGSTYGTTSLSGTIVAANGVPDPNIAPTLANSWPPLAVTGTSGSTAPYCLIDTGTHWLVARGQKTGTLQARFYWIDKTTGASAGSAALTDGAKHYSNGVGMTKIGSDYFLLWIDGASFHLKVTKLASSGVGNMTDGGTLTWTALASTAYVGSTAGTDGTNILVAYTPTSTPSNTVVQQWTTAGASAGADTTVANGANANSLFYVGKGSYDYGATRLQVGWKDASNVNRVYTFNGTTWDSANSWLPDSTTVPTAVGWDATRFFSISSTLVLSKYATGRTTASDIYGSSTFYDGNATGSTHESGRSPEVGPYTWLARAYITASGQPAPQAGISTQDAANLIRFYIGTAAGSTKLQTSQPAQGVISYQYETVSFAGAAPPAPGAGTFGAIGTPGIIRSDNYSATGLGTGWQLKGDGTINGRILGDTGWINMTLINGWVAYDARVPQYRRINGIVYTQGVIKSGTSGTNFWVAPAGFRMAATTANEGTWYTSASGGQGLIQHAASSGGVGVGAFNASSVGAANVSTYCFLTGISYCADS